MADVARAAGVSVTTVSHVLNQTRKVSPEKEAAVRRVVEESGYIKDTVAGSLRTGGTRTVGVAMTAISNPYFADVVHAIERTTSAAGYSLLLVDTHDEPQTERRVIGELLMRRTDAVILAPSADPSAAIRDVQRHKVPMVLVDRLFDADLDQIGSRNTAPTAELVDHLVGHGHTRIAMVAGRRGVATTEERVAGYRRSLRRHDLTVDPELLVDGEGTEQDAEQAALSLLDLTRPPTAVVVGNNLMTIAVMQAMSSRGLRVPQDMALVSFDDFPWAALFRPRLSVMAQPTQEMGRRAVEMLFSRMAEPDAPRRRVRLRPTFRCRESCGCEMP